MKKIMGIIGWIAISPIILAETLVKIVWGVLFYIFYPLWKCIFSTWAFNNLEAYTHFKHEYIVIPKLLELWDL
jgi:hypothetical protein